MTTRTLTLQEGDRPFASVEPSGTRNVAVRLLDGWSVLLADYPGGGGIGWHDHPYDSVHLTIRGGSDEEYGRWRREKRAGTAQFYRAYARHRTCFGVGGARVLHVVRAGADGRPCGRLTAMDEPEPDPRPLGEMLRELVSGDRASRVSIQALCEELAASLVPSRRLRGERPAWLREACEALSACDAWSLGELASEVGVNASHMARVFRVRFGCTPGEFARRARLERAAGELSAGTRAIAAIELDAGFYDQSHFGRAFRERYGVTPGAYREAARA